MKKSAFILTIALIQTARGLRIAPKLDFDSSSSGAAIRPSEEKYLRFDDIDVTKFKHAQPTVNGAGIICVSGNCETTTKSQNEASADVTVHVHTNINLEKTQGDKTAEVPPDVPIIIGNKASSDYVPTNVPNYNQFHRNNNLAPSYQPVYPQQYPVHQPELQPRRSFGRYPTVNGIRGNNWSGMTWYNPTQDATVQYNPLEFKKVYTNAWSSLRSDLDKILQNPSFYQQIENRYVVPQWNPSCNCHSSGDGEFNGYSQVPAATLHGTRTTAKVDGKLGSLV